MLAQPVPGLDGRDLAGEGDARGEVQQLFDDGGAGRPGGVRLRRAGRTRD